MMGLSNCTASVRNHRPSSMFAHEEIFETVRSVIFCDSLLVFSCNFTINSCCGDVSTTIWCCKVGSFDVAEGIVFSVVSIWRAPVSFWLVEL